MFQLYIYAALKIKDLLRVARCSQVISCAVTSFDHVMSFKSLACNTSLSHYTMARSCMHIRVRVYLFDCAVLTMLPLSQSEHPSLNQ